MVQTKAIVSPFRWPTAGVGTFHPLAVERPAKSRALEFVQFATAAAKGVAYKDAKKLLAPQHQTAETRKSLFEEMGLLYVPYRSESIVLTPVGVQLLNLLTTTDYTSDRLAQRRLNALLVWALSNAQINRPQSRGTPRPKTEEWTTCDVRPYAAAWQAIEDLDGWISTDEFFGVLWHMHRVDQYQSVIDRILDGRHRRSVHVDPKVFKKGGALMNSRIYWMSHLSGGGVFLQATVDENDREIWRYNDDTRKIIETVLAFSRGCTISKNVSFKGRSYESTEEYFFEVAGRPCPPFLFSGSVRVENVTTQPIVVLEGYSVHRSGDIVIIDGGPELCSLPIKAPCYHRSISDRILRLDAKAETSDGGVQLRLGLGRPFRGVL